MNENKKNDDICTIQKTHPNSIQKVKKEKINEEIILELSETFKVFGDPTRVKIMNILSIEELCVCDISEILNLSQSAVSHQLRILRNKNLVRYKKVGKQAYYSLSDKHVVQILKIGVEHVTE
ncbi:MAG: metalloregulator ArsR/SmtB family transcription factor [Methanobacteriaceae archaeon]|nr:metalloregulator ArsR/SmtB family transcription factor [Methanobacteriaceae archaeon]